MNLIQITRDDREVFINLDQIQHIDVRPKNGTQPGWPEGCHAMIRMVNSVFNLSTEEWNRFRDKFTGQAIFL